MKISLKQKTNKDYRALILAAGCGTRLGKKTEKMNKCMLKFGKKYLIEYSLDHAANLGVGEIVVVVGHMAEDIINTYGNEYRGIKVKYVIQKEQRGLVHAMECAEKALRGKDFFLFLGDEFLYKPDHQPMIDQFEKDKKTFCICGMIKVKDRNLIKKTYTIFFDKETKRIFRLVEKPNSPANNLMGTGCVLFRKEILDYFDVTPVSPKRGEKELPDLIQCAIDDNKGVYYHTITSTFVNVNTPDDVKALKNIEGKKK